MAMFIHLAPEKRAKAIVRSGIRLREIHAIRAVPQVVGWRSYPGAHGRRPCGCPYCQPRGQIRSRKLGERYEKGL
jgi:hypothetical protein